MSAARHCAYLFEAKGIQRWIFAAGKLRDIIGASDLLAGLARADGQDAIGHVLEALGLAVGEAVAVRLVPRTRSVWKPPAGTRMLFMPGALAPLAAPPFLLQRRDSKANRLGR